jgi:hypothetical protein
MTKFADQLFDDLMREHASTLAHTRVAAPKRYFATRPVLMSAGASGLAVAATVGTLVASGGNPAYAVTTHPNGTVTVAVYQKSGIGGANAKLRQFGERVVVVPVEPGCPSISSLPAPVEPGGPSVGAPTGTTQSSAGTTQSGKPTGRDGKPTGRDGKPTGSDGKPPIALIKTKDGVAVVQPLSIPAGDIQVLAYSTTASGSKSMSTVLTSGPVPSCVSVPSQPDGGGTPVGGVGGPTGK